MVPGQKRLTLVYRVFARQHRDTSSDFTIMEEALGAAAMDAGADLVADPVSEFTRPCFAEEIEGAQKLGFLLTHWSSGTLFVIREQQYHFVLDRPQQLLEKVLEQFPTTFSQAFVTEEYRSETIAN